MTKTDEAVRNWLYEWHGGQRCPVYAAASSGLVADESAVIWNLSLDVPADDFEEFKRWLDKLPKIYVKISGETYRKLPWANH